jgi:hypothetical protein
MNEIASQSKAMSSSTMAVVVVNATAPDGATGAH